MHDFLPSLGRFKKYGQQLSPASSAPAQIGTSGNMADVVVVTATCNRLNLLSSVCLTSVLQQTAVPSTVVVVDDSQVGLDQFMNCMHAMPEHLNLHRITHLNVYLCTASACQGPQQQTAIFMLCYCPKFTNLAFACQLTCRRMLQLSPWLKVLCCSTLQRFSSVAAAGRSCKTTAQQEHQGHGTLA
jgi:hypothetical protein